MNELKIKIMTAVLVTTIIVSLKAEQNDDNSWILRAENCDQDLPINYESLEVKDFEAINEDGKNIYQIALGKHKETGSIPCAKMAIELENRARQLRRKLRKNVRNLEKVEETFEASHK